MSIDPTDPRPAYQQIAAHLRAAIEAGEYKPGAFVPPIRELSKQYGVAQVTASHAISLLVEEGLLARRPSRGMIVRPGRPILQLSSSYVTEVPGRPLASWRSEVERIGRAGDQRLVEVTRVPAPPEVAARLRLEPDDQVVVRRRVMLVDSEPYQLADSYFPSSIAAGTRLARPVKIKGGSIAALKSLGLEPERHLEELSAHMPTAEQRLALGLGPAVPVLRMIRTTYVEGDRPVEVDDSIISADRNILVYEVPARR